ncbi:UvrD-helicase domain-containing protein [Mammaliicoccus lentus]|uniref:UvrD-helicase domain-containing protein n=1 Tax=Mammaliicoccus lentus TaxID=42858 RepID=UPI0003123AE9|nr:UvrD-helicase domain-containing protein [Mammaliicoccus lentus]MBF0794691.1 ATP-dependent helicase [Mammaliicoccus lentus]TFV15635.1 ATP-dependent helicase [Mammaliicoccus lentus]
MVKNSIEKEVTEALRCIEQKQNFVFSGGAGSGKTYSLISLIQEVTRLYPLKTIVCITYTNNAVREIRSRIDNEKLVVSTIHEFMWNMIKKYQIEIKDVIVELVNDTEQTLFNKPKDIDCFTIMELPEKIEYDEYISLKNGKISHDYVLLVAQKMFSKYPKLSDILKDTSNFIFIDEYQDTDPKVIDIFLNQINKSKKECIIGFFGDPMQSIYDTGTGSLEDFNLIRIDKIQNRRNPKSVIDLANKLRESVDSIQQEPSLDKSAPNMRNGKIINGSARFIYADKIEIFEDVKNHEIFQNWDFKNSSNTKVLLLTHKFNANNSGFSDLYNLYNNDKLYDLIDKIRSKLNNEKICVLNKTFEEIAMEVNVVNKQNKKSVLELIKSDEYYSKFYYDLKTMSWKDEVEKILIDRESLLSYKLNGLTGKYEGTSKRDEILLQLDKIYELIECYQEGKFNEFLRKTKYQIKNYKDKQKLYSKMNYFENLDNKSIHEVFQEAVNIFYKQIDDRFNEFINGKGKYLWNRLSELPFQSYINSINYQREYLPYATQHSVKGSEYDNVLLVLDNGKWNKYDFKTLFGKGSINNNVINRTRKIFYVSCTRAKENLIVFMVTGDQIIIEKAKLLFGAENTLDANLLLK